MSDDEKSASDNKISYEKRLTACSLIAKPMANKKETKKLHKLVKKGSSSKSVKRGLKEVVKAIRKGSKGMCIIAGDINPVDVIMHLPVYCEENDIPYIYVPSKQDLGAAANTKRPTSCIFIIPKAPFDSKELYEEATLICKNNETQIPRS